MSKSFLKIKNKENSNGNDGNWTLKWQFEKRQDVKQAICKRSTNA